MADPEPIPARDRLLAVAMLEFATRGLAGARVDQIARDAEVNKQLIYYYFGDKQGLYEAALQKMVSQNVLRDMKARDLSTAFRAMARNTFESRDGQWVRLLVREALDHPPILALEDARRESIVAQIRSIAEAQAGTERSPHVDPDLLYLMLVFLSIGPSLLPQMVRLATGTEPSSEEFRDRYLHGVDRLLGAAADDPSGGASAS